jgi:hypothetical protein
MMLSTRTLFLLFSLSVSLLAPTAVHAATDTAQASAPDSGVMVPLYSYPGPSWDSVIQAKLANPSVPIVAIINPHNGPGRYYDPAYAAGIARLRAAGITVLGYDYTSYGGRSIASAMADVEAYKGWYPVNGIFFDEMPDVSGYQAYYASLSSFADSLGLNFTVGNPGHSLPSSYLGTVSQIVTYEDQGLPSAADLANSTLDMPRSQLVMIAYGVGQLSDSTVAELSDYAGYLYVTDQGLPNPYASLPDYFSKLVAALAPPTSTSPPVGSSTPLPVSITVDSIGYYGDSAVIQLSYGGSAAGSSLVAVERNSAGQTVFMVTQPLSSSGSGNATVESSGLPAGIYSVELFATSGGIAASTPLWLVVSA